MSESNPRGKATEDALDGLHGLLAKTLVSELVRANTPDKEGHIAGPSPALLGQVIKFLKDNGIDSPARAAKVRDALAGVMPNFDGMDEHTEMRGNA